MIRVSVAIMHHPRRAHLLPDLLASLDREPAVITDRYNDRWETGRRALLAVHPAATHHMVIQDDAIVCRDLCAGVGVVLEHVPAGSPVGLYLGSRQPHPALTARLWRAARAAGHSFVVFDESPMWGVGVVVPADQVGQLVAFGDQQTDTRSYDGRLRRWYTRSVFDQWYPVPSLVDHRTDGPSMVGRRRNQVDRVAFEFVGRGRSAVDVDWSTGATYHRPGRRRPPTRP